MKKNVAGQVISAHLISKTDGSDVTSGTTIVYVTIDNGTQTTGSGTVTHKGNGEWLYQPTQSETNGDHIIFTFVNPNAISVGVQVYTNYPQTGDSYGIVNNATYGNSALNTDLDTLLSRIVGTLASGTHQPQSGDAYAVVTNATYGNSALNSDLDAIKAKTDQLSFTITNRVDANVTHVSGTSQTARDLGANLDTTISSRAPASTALSNAVWTDTKAGYLDTNISSRSTLTAEQVWEYATRTLTSFGTLVSDIWSYVTRTLTSLGSFVSDVWSYSSRTLTSFGDLSSNVSAIKAKTDNLPEAIKKNQALNNFTFVMIDSTDHVTPKTGLSVNAQRSIDGGSFAPCLNSVSEVGYGVYKINLAASDLNGEIITLMFTATGADPRLITIKTSA